MKKTLLLEIRRGSADPRCYHEVWPVIRGRLRQRAQAAKLYLKEGMFVMGIQRFQKPVHSPSVQVRRTRRRLGPQGLFSLNALLAILFVSGCSTMAMDGTPSPQASPQASTQTSHGGSSTKGNLKSASPENRALGSAVDAGSEGDDEAIEGIAEGEEKDPEVVRTPDGSHISDVGGDALLDASAEAEVEATSVAGSSEAAQEDSLGNVPTVKNERVDWWINYYTSRGRDRFQRHLDHADSYAPVVQGILQEHQVADELFYIALIESGFITKARSHAGAVGVWQFIRGTGKRYGLTIGKGIDERKDPMRSTVAAARYLTDLYNIFNNWYLAFAAYNCGEYRVLRAIVAGKTRDFWKLSELGLLPKETRHYVPKFLAAMEIARNRERYGFENKEVAARPELKPLSVPGGTRLTELSKSTSIPLAELVAANPHLLNKRTPPNVKTYPVWIPAVAAGSAEVAVGAQGQPQGGGIVRNVAMTTAQADETVDEDVVEFHRVSKGQTLTSIAHEYGTSVKKLRALNGFNKPKVNLRIGQKIKVSGPMPTQVASKTKFKSGKRQTTAMLEAANMNGTRENQQLTSEEYVFYRVRSGDNLNKIGKRFGVGAEQIKEANSLGRNELFAGEVLRVPATGG